MSTSSYPLALPGVPHEPRQLVVGPHPALALGLPVAPPRLERKMITPDCRNQHPVSMVSEWSTAYGACGVAKR